MKTIMTMILMICLTGCVNLGQSSDKAPSQLAAERQMRAAQTQAEHPNAWNPSPAMLNAIGEQNAEDAKVIFNGIQPSLNTTGPY